VSVLTVDPFEREEGRDAALWSVATLVVAALHVGLAVAYLLLRPAPEGQAEAPVIDVAFMPATSAPAPAPPPEALPAEPTPRVDQSELAPPKNEPVARESVTELEPPPVKTETAPPPEPVPPPVALQIPEPTAEPAHPDQVTVMPPPAKPAEPAPEAKPEKIEKEKVEREKAEKEKKTAPKPAAAPGSKRTLAMAPNAGAESEGANAARSLWESEVVAHIRHYATYPSGGRDTGTVSIGVTIDRNGRLLSRRLARSSGSSMLDGAAMTVIERAQPYPHFPPSMTQSQIALTVPLHLRPQ
jgi:protein TonB